MVWGVSRADALFLYFFVLEVRIVYTAGIGEAICTGNLGNNALETVDKKRENILGT